VKDQQQALVLGDHDGRELKSAFVDAPQSMINLTLSKNNCYTVKFVLK
jgi:hypothetical protein